VTNAHKVAVIPGDGIGIEVIESGLQLFASLADFHGGFQLDVTRLDWGSDRYGRTGALMHPDGANRRCHVNRLAVGRVSGWT